MSRNAMLFTCLLVLGSSFAGCTTVDKTVDKDIHKDEAAWKSRFVRDFKMRSPVVIVAEPAAERAKLEDELVRKLDARGLQAVASHTFVPNLNRIDIARFKEYVASNFHDSVIVVDPFAAAEADVVRTTDVQEISGSNFIAVAEEGWTTDQMWADYGLMITVWETASWKPVWIGETDTMVQMDSGPAEQATMVTTSVESERLY